MTEAEWLTSHKPVQMLSFLSDRASQRKRRLFAVACCRHIWQFLADERSKRAVEVAEQFADDSATHDELVKCFCAAQAAADEVYNTVYNKLMAGVENEYPESIRPAHLHATEAAAAANAARLVAVVNPEGLTEVPSKVFLALYHGWQQNPNGDHRRSEAFRTTIESQQALLLREIFGNPFRLPAIDSAWLTWNDGTVVKLAQSIYADRAFERMPRLAGALENAGCDNADILNHCRGGGAHVRGCWVVDLVLGKA